MRRLVGRGCGALTAMQITAACSALNGTYDRTPQSETTADSTSTSSAMSTSTGDGPPQDSGGAVSGSSGFETDGATTDQTSDSTGVPDGQCPPTNVSPITITLETDTGVPVPPPQQCDTNPLSTPVGQYTVSNGAITHQECSTNSCPCTGNGQIVVLTIGDVPIAPFPDGCGFITTWVAPDQMVGNCGWFGAAVVDANMLEAPVFIATNGRQLDVMAFPGAELIELEPYERACEYRDVCDGEPPGPYAMRFADDTVLDVGGNAEIEIQLD
ncbi:MAG: hypothetical protein K0V04_04655, partial [Deltaproteobacteria bacterium]|nr:hypothetical protein [Deltaproteobacteria bacterium]